MSRLMLRRDGVVPRNRICHDNGIVYGVEPKLGACTPDC